MGTRRKKSRRRSNKRNYSLIGSSYARRLRVETLEDRRLLAVFSVSNLDDVGAGSLRAAIDIANAAAGADEIQFSVNGTLNIASQLPTITDSLTITGPAGANSLTIDAGNGTDNTFNTGDGFRIFDVDDGTLGNVLDVTLRGLTLTGGDATASGGAIFSRENLTVENSTISGNAATGAFVDGGGIFSETNLTDQTTTITNSTLSGNTTTGRGGGIFNVDGLTVIEHSTITGNSAAAGQGSGVASYGDGLTTTQVGHTIISGNTGDDDVAIVPSATNSFVSLGFNLIGSGNALGVFSGDGTSVINTSPGLGLLADNGGPTPTHALLLSSPAIDAGDPAIVFNATEFDQRGAPFARVLGNAIDIGAFEVQPVTQIVSTTDDVSDGDFSPGNLSLREAINQANTNPGADTITFSSLFDTTQTIALTSQLPTITDDLTITGPGADLLAIDAGNTTTPLMGDGFRIFEINDGTAGLIDVSLSDLTLTGADVPHAPPSGSFSGGAIFNFETLTINRTSIVANRARFGGGISQVTTASTTITNSTISGNVASQNGGGVSSAGVFTATNVTISNNSADGGGGIILGAGTGDPSATLNLINSTVTGNTATNGSHGILFFSTYGPSTATLDHTIVNDAVVGIGGAPTLSGSFNLFANADPGITGTNNQFSTDPLLGPLQDNGGPTDTHALLLGSPAIDAGDPTIVFNATEFDQRGAPFARVLGNAIDIGAYEVQAVTQIVSTTDDVSDDDFSPGNLSLREAINQANTNPGADTITFSSLFDTTQTIALTSQLPTITDSLTITGPGQTLLTLDAGNGTDDTFDTGDGFRILEIDNGDNGNLIDVKISGLTLTGGDVSGLFPGDPAGRGGAIRNLENLILTASTISGNATSGSSDFGGGIYHSLYNGTLDVTNTTISDNTTSGSGGGISNRTALVTITSSTISGNSARNGGGIRTSSGAVTLTSSTISGNTSSIDGGGIFTSSGAVTLTSSTVSGNTSNDDGGGIYTEEGAVTLTSSTVSGNTSGGDGGGIYTGIDTYDSDVTIQNSIVAGNMAGGSGPDFFRSGGTLTINHSLIGVADGLTITGNVGNQTGTVASPLNPLLGPLADNGGPTIPSGAVIQTHALLPGSPALDAITSLASGGVITQTTTHNVDFPATNAVDGDLGTFSHTAINDTNPHWQHNPTGGGRIYQIVLHNRQDGSQERLRDIKIEIFNGAEQVIFATGLLNPNNVLNSPDKIVVDVAALNGGAPVIGPFIRVSREPDPNGTNEADKNVLSLAEVEIVSTAPGAPLFDQRGKLRIRDGGGDALARIDIGAYEAQAAPSADFDTDGDVDGADFLAWQRGFGKTNAQRADGNSDDDNDTDASDLAAWQVSFGQPQPPLLLAVQSEAVATSGQSAVAHAEFREELFDSALIDAALTLEWLGNDSDEETSFVAKQATLEAVFASGDELEGLAPTGSMASNSDAAIASSDYLDFTVESTVEFAAERWLADELLERVFG